MELGSATRWLMDRGFELRLKHHFWGKANHHWSAMLTTKDGKETIEATEYVATPTGIMPAHVGSAASEGEVLKLLEHCVRAYFAEERRAYEEATEESRQQIEHYTRLEQEFPLEQKP